MRKKILIAEDDPASRELLREVLEPHGYEVLEAADGPEALRKIENEIPDLVLLDIQLPSMNGLSLVQHLRQDPRFASLRVVAVTAYAMRGDRERILDAGFNAYLTKPIDAVALRNEIERELATGCSRTTSKEKLSSSEITRRAR